MNYINRMPVKSKEKYDKNYQKLKDERSLPAHVLK